MDMLAPPPEDKQRLHTRRLPGRFVASVVLAGTGLFLAPACSDSDNSGQEEAPGSGATETSVSGELTNETIGQEAVRAAQAVTDLVESQDIPLQDSTRRPDGQRSQEYLFTYQDGSEEGGVRIVINTNGGSDMFYVSVEDFDSLSGDELHGEQFEYYKHPGRIDWQLQVSQFPYRDERDIAWFSPHGDATAFGIEADRLTDFIGSLEDAHVAAATQ
jgi:hypothetical protein